MKPSSLRTRILFIAMFPALTLALVLGTYFGYTRVRDLARNLEDHGQAVVEQFAPACQYGVFSGNLDYLAPLVDSLLAEPDIVSVTIRDARGDTLLSRSRPTPTEGKVLLFQADIPSPTLPLGEEGFEIDENEPAPSSIGTVTIGISTATLIHQTEQVMQNSLLIILLGLLGTLALAAAIAQGLVRPIERVTRAVDRIAGGEFDVRLTEQATGELQRLQEGINEMARRLAITQQGLREEVDRATRQLRSALAEMEEKNRELDQARQEAQRASRERTELIANMSHEIRTPLNGILGFIDLMLRTPLTEDQREYIGTIRKSANNLLAIVNDILDFSRIESGRLRLEPVPFDLREPFEDTLDLLSPLAGEKRLELVLLIYEDVPTRLIGDVDRLRQILLNLIGNAVKFTHSGSIVVRVMLDEALDEACRLRVSITDTGIGMNEAQQRHLFRAFSQGHGSLNRRYGGSGLGLFISRMLVEQMGGEIGLESREGEGSTFWFTLQLKLQPARTGPAPQAPESLPVLLYCVHDQARKALAHPLARWGLEVHEAENIAALEALLESSSDREGLIILSLVDDENDEATSLALVERFRHRGHRLMVLLTTLEKRQIDRLQDAGADRCLCKPVRLETLRTTLWKLLGWQESESAHFVERRRRPRVRDADLSGVRILVADDSEINRRLVSLQLAPFNVAVDEASNGEEALRLAREHRYDLMLMDIRMPVMTGEEATRRIRAGDGPNRETPVIALTANTLEGESERLAGFGINETLIKPVSEYRLLECIARWLGRDDLLDNLTGRSPDDSRERLLDELREHLVGELPDHRSELERAFAEGDLERLRDAAHRLAGSAAWCQFQVLHEAALALEQACIETAPPERLAERLTGCLDEIDALRQTPRARQG